MRRYSIFALGLATALIAAQILDRIAAVVGNTAITESEVIREARIAAILNGAAPNIGPEEKRRAAERLVEQELLRKEISLTRYANSGQAESEQMLNQLRSRYPSQEEYQRALERDGITEDDLRQHLAWQAMVLKFTEFRFHGDNVDQQLDAWLKEARSRTQVQFYEEAFR